MSHQLALSMFTKHVCLDTASINTYLLAQDPPQPCRVKKSATPNDLPSRQTRVLLTEICQYVDRVGYEKDYCILSKRLHVIGGRFQNGQVAG